MLGKTSIVPAVGRGLWSLRFHPCISFGPLRIAFGLLWINEEAFPERRFQDDDGKKDGDSRHKHFSEHIYPHATVLLVCTG